MRRVPTSFAPARSPEGFGDVSDAPGDISDTLADALQCLVNAGIPLDGASDHGVSEALYLREPDDNGVERYWDRPPDRWPRTPDGRLAMINAPLDLQALLGELEESNASAK